jgi:hypothetical protein
MQEIEIIDDRHITLRYPGGREQAAEYILKDEMLMIDIVTDRRIYEYEMQTSESLILTARYNYVNNILREKRAERISEKRIITFTKLP